METYVVTVDKDVTRWFKPDGNTPHRLNGPAVECADGYKAWWVDGLRTRLDGPAIEEPDGRKFWYIENWEYDEKGFIAELRRRVKLAAINAELAKMATVSAKNVELDCSSKIILLIDGKKYTLTPA